MKYIVVSYFLIFLLFSCKKYSKEKTNHTLAKTTTTGFEILGKFTNFNTQKVYLNKIIETRLYPIDSAIVSKNLFLFKGIVHYPERFALTYKNFAVTTIFIIENKKIQLQLNGKHISEPKIIGSPLNTKLNSYKTSSKRIFNKIDILFPKFQKARLENNAKKLNEIGLEMKTIENEFTNFTYQYIQKNNNSFLAAMLLRDQLKTTIIDTLKISNTYKLLTNEVKKCADAEIIATTLKLH